MDNVEIKISQDLIKPIIEQKIQAALVEAMGSYPQMLEQIVKAFLTQKVDSSGKESGYSSDKPRMYHLVNTVLTNACKDAIINFMATKQSCMQAEFEKFFNSKKGQSQLIAAMQDGFLKSLNDKWRLHIEFKTNT